MGDFDKKNRQLVYDQTTRRVHFKLYKAGKVWLAAGLATFTFGVTQMVGTTTLHAATVSETQTTVDNGLQQSSVTLSESAATANSAADSTADSSVSTVVSTDSASAADESLNESSAASVASQSESNASSATNESTADVAASAVASGDVSSSASGQNTDSSASNVTASNSTSAYGSPQTKSLVKTAVAATTPATSSATDPLPAGFSVGEPTYPDGVFHYDEDSDWYTFAQIGTGSGTITFAIDRATQSNIQVGTVSVTDGVASISAVQNLAAGKSTYDGAMIFNEDQTIDVVASITYIFDVYAYKDGNDQPWSGYAFLKPILQTQTTEYIDQDGNQIADPVVMTGLSGQSYTTSPSTQITGYNPTASDNSTGFMSPFTSNGQTFVEVLYNIDGSKKGTLTYTVDDYKTGSMDYDFEPATPSYSAKKGTLKYGEDPEAATVQTSGGNYTVKNPYVPQTTTITYTYNASDVNVTVKYVDENGNAIATDGVATGKFKQAITIDQPNITGYTYDQNYTVSDTDNVAQYTVTDYTGENVVTLHYTTDDENVVILHMDSDGNLLNDATIGTGKYNQTFTADATNDKSFDIPGYRLDPTSNLAVKIGAGPNLINLKYDKLYTETINYVDQNGQQIDSSLLNNAATTLSGIVGENLAITSPKIAGYTAYADNPSSYTVAANETTITLHYVKTTMTVAVNVTPTTDGTKVTATVVDGDGNSVNAGQPIDPNDPTGPKWPSNLTTDEITNPVLASRNANDLDTVVIETVYPYTLSADGTTLTKGQSSIHEVYFVRTATVDFSDIKAPKITFGDWTPAVGLDMQNLIASYGADVIGSDLIPAINYEMAYAPKLKSGQTVLAYDGSGAQIQMKSMTFQGQSFTGIPAVEVSADSDDLTYYVVSFNSDQLSKQFTRTIHFQTADGTQLKPDTQQTASYTVKTSLDVSAPTNPKLISTVVWTDNNDTFAAVTAPDIQGYTATNGVQSQKINQTDKVDSEATIVYTANSVTADVAIPSNIGNQTVTGVVGTVGETIAVPVPVIEGYTANKTTVPATVNPDGTITTTETVTYTGNSVDYEIIPVDNAGNPLYGTSPIVETGLVGTKITVPNISGYTPVATNQLVPADGSSVEVTYIPINNYGMVGENDNAEVATPVNLKEKVQQPAGVNANGQTVTITPVDLNGDPLYGQTPITIPGVAGYEVTVPEIPGYTPVTNTTVTTNGINQVVYVPNANYGTVGENESTDDGAIVSDPSHVYRKGQQPEGAFIDMNAGHMLPDDTAEVSNTHVYKKVQQPDGVNANDQTVTITPVDLSGNPLYGQTPITIPGVAGYEVPVPNIPGYTPVTDTTVPTNGVNKVVYIPKTDNGTVGENNATDDGTIVSDPSHVYQKAQQPGGVNTDGQTVTITPVDLDGNPLYGQTPITIPGVAGYEVTVPEIPGYTPATDTTVPTNGVNKVVYVPNTDYGTVGKNETTNDGTIVNDPSHVYQKVQQPEGTFIDMNAGHVLPDDTAEVSNTHVYKKVQQPGGVNANGQTVTITPVDLSGNPLYGQTPITIPGVAGYEVTVPEIPGYTAVTDTTVPTNGINKVVYVPNANNGTVGENETNDDGTIVSDPSHVYQKAQQPGGVNTDGQTVTITPVDLSGNPLYGQTPITIPGVAGYEVTVPEIPGYTPVTGTTVPTNGENKVVYVPKTDNGTVGENDTPDDGTIVSDPNHVYQKVQQPAGTNANGQTVTITPVDLSGNPLYGQTPITIPGVAGYEVTVPEIPGYTPVTSTTVPTNGVNKVVYVPNVNNGTVGENNAPDDGAIVSDPSHVYQKAQQPDGVNANGQMVTITPVDLSGNPLYGQTPITIPGVAGYEVTVPEIPGYTAVTDTTVPTNGENKVVYVPKTDSGTVGENDTPDDGAIVSDPSHVYQKVQQPGGVNTDGQTVTITPVDLSGNPLYGQTPITIPGVAGYEVTVPEIPGYTPVTGTTVPTNGVNKVVYVPNANNGTVGENNTPDDGAIVSDPNHVYQKVQQPAGTNANGQTVTITPVDLSGNPLYGQTPITIPGVAGYEVTVPEIPGYTPVTDTTVPTNGENKVVYVPKTDYGTVGENNAPDDGAIVSDPNHVYQKVQQPAGVNTDGQTVTITPVDLSGNPLYGQTPITIPGVAGYEVTVPEIPGYTPVTGTTVPTNGINKVVYVPNANNGTVGENNTADDGAIVSDPNHVYQKVQQPDGVNTDGQMVTITPVDLSGNPLYGQTPITIPGVAGYEVTVPEIPGYTAVTDTTVPTNGVNKVVYVPNVNNGTVGENETNDDGIIVSDPSHVYQKAQQPAGVNTDGQTVTITPVDLSGNPLYGQTPITIPGVAGYEVTVPEIPGYTAVTATTVPTNGENKVVYVPVNGGSVDQNGTPETSEPVTDPDHVYEKDQVPDTDVPFVDLATATVTITPVDVNGNPLYGQSPIKVQGVAGYSVTVPNIAGYTPTETTIIATNGVNVVTYIPNKNAGIVPSDSGEVATNVRVYERNQSPDTDVPHTSVTANTGKQVQNSISTTETVLDESNQSGTPSASQSNRDHSSVSAARLPQTDNASNYLGKLGVIMLSVVSLITALGARRKKDSKMHDHD